MLCFVTTHLIFIIRLICIIWFAIIYFHGILYDFIKLFFLYSKFNFLYMCYVENFKRRWHLIVISQLNFRI